MRRDHRIAAVFTACVYMAGMMLFAVAGCGDQRQSELVLEIRNNASRTLESINSYYAQAEIRKPGEVGEREYSFLMQSESWVKGNDLFKETTESSGREALGISVTKSTSILNGYTTAGMAEDSIDIWYNCTPIDSNYSSYDHAYDMVGEIQRVVEADNISARGCEEVLGEDSYKLEMDYSDDEWVSGSTDAPDRVIMWVNKKDSVCLKKDSFKEGVLIESLEVSAYEVNPAIPDSVFAIETQGKQYVTERDMGYREITFDEAVTYCGIEPRVPAELPEGFGMSTCGWRDPRASGSSLDLPQQYTPVWYKEFYISYTDGFAEINICEGKKYDAYPAIDSLGMERGLSVMEVELSGGRTGYYERETQTLYFYIDDIKTRIRADMPMEELVRIAESME